MPTTVFMLYKDDTYSVDFKNRFRTKVLKDFKIALPTKDEEMTTNDETRKRIAEAITRIRKKLHKNAFLLQHNIEYGAIRNSLGGAILAVIISLVNFFVFDRYFPNNFAKEISIVLAIVYCGWIAMGPWLVRVYGNNYAKILFREYMN